MSYFICWHFKYVYLKYVLLSNIDPVSERPVLSMPSSLPESMSMYRYTIGPINIAHTVLDDIANLDIDAS